MPYFISALTWRFKVDIFEMSGQSLESWATASFSFYSFITIVKLRKILILLAPHKIDAFFLQASPQS
jgi:hypothetical protein